MIEYQINESTTVKFDKNEAYIFYWSRHNDRSCIDDYDEGYSLHIKNSRSFGISRAQFLELEKLGLRVEKDIKEIYNPED